MSAVTRYHPCLDGLRAIAIGLVLAAHAGLRVGRAGALGVDIFFVLSGYLITGLLVRERETYGSIELKAFYLRRALRLFPALLVLITVGALVLSFELHTPTRQLLLGGLVAGAYLTDVLSFTSSTVWAVWGNTWSLSIEEHFYLIWPPLLIFLLRSGRRSAAFLVVGAGALVGFATVMLLAVGSPTAGPARFYFQPQAHAGALLLGCVVALAPVAPRWTRHLAPASLVALAGVALLSPGPQNEVYFQVSIPAVWLLTGAMLLGLEFESLTARALALRPLRRVGVVSYGLYLYHQVVFLVVAQHLHAQRAVVLVVQLAVALLVAELSFRLLESPIRRYGHRSRQPLPTV